MDVEQANTNASITTRVVLVSIFLTTILAIANTYLALKVGILTSASIPAAVLAMALLSRFKDVSIYEYNLIQTSASAGEAVAGGIVYVVPALVIINYWHRFDYFTNAMIAIIGGLLGLLLSIPLRKMLVTNPHLAFPEGKAIAEVLKMHKQEKRSIRPMLDGLGFAAFVEFFQGFLRILPESIYKIFSYKQKLFVVGVGFSPALVGAGFLMGVGLSSSLLIGSLISGVVLLPIVNDLHPGYCQNCSVGQVTELLWNDSIRFIAIATMLTASIIALMRLIPSLFRSIKQSWQRDLDSQSVLEHDIPLPYILLLINVLVIALFCLFVIELPFASLSFTRGGEDVMLWGGVLMVLVLGIIYSTITAYFSGLLGVTATPGSGLFISLILLCALFMKICVKYFGGIYISSEQIKAAEAASIMIASVVGGAAAVSIDNIQDLKVGHIIGAVPWRQQVMLMIGVLISALIIPFVMQLLLTTYGLGHTGYMTGVDFSKALPAPPASLLATMTKAVFEDAIRYDLFITGALIAALLFVLQKLFSRLNLNFSALGIAIGMYLPYSTTVPIFIGGIIACFFKSKTDTKQDSLTMFACGLLAGSAILEIIISFLFILSAELNLSDIFPTYLGFSLSVCLYIGMCVYIKKYR